MIFCLRCFFFFDGSADKKTNGVRKKKKTKLTRLEPYIHTDRNQTTNVNEPH